MTPRATPPFRADQVGSLLRPAGLRAARDDFAAGAIGAAEVRVMQECWVLGCSGRKPVALKPEIGSAED